MSSIVTVTSPATSFDLVDLEDVKEELDITGSDDDSALQRIITATSYRFARVCNRTFAQETLTEVFRGAWSLSPLILRRRPITSVVSISETGSLVDASGYEVETDTGRIYRLSSDTRIGWSTGKLEVVYVTGYDPIPPDISDAVMAIIRHKVNTAGRDPLTKSFQIDGVGREEYWVPLQNPGSSASSLPLDLQPVADMIAALRVPALA